MRPNQIYKVLHGKGNDKQNKKPTGWEKSICEWQRLHFQTVHPTQQQQQQNKHPSQKMGRRTKQTFHQRRNTDGQ